MRTAKKIFEGYKRHIDGSGYWCTEKDFIEAVNEARIEAIKESAEQIISDGNPLVAKDKILKLIDNVR